jgi:hypothetical protein
MFRSASAERGIATEHCDFEHNGFDSFSPFPFSEHNGFDSFSRT